ncbi:MAG: hypothetical protein R2752_05815 [Vicinamibacterales bacterium]
MIAVLLIVVPSCGGPAPLRARPHAQGSAMDAVPEAWRTRAALQQVVRQWTAADVEARERAVEAGVDPDERETRRALLTFYGFGGTGTATREQAKARRRRHALWLVAHDAGDVETIHLADIPAGPGDDTADAEGRALVEAAWIERAGRPDAPPVALFHAASLLEADDPARAREFLTRGRRIDPDGAAIAPERWTVALGRLAARVLMSGASPAADTVRRELEATTDADLLADTAAALRQFGHDDAALQPLVATLLARALALDPDHPRAHVAQVRAIRAARTARMYADLGTDRNTWIGGLAQLPEATQLEYLPEVAEHWLVSGDGFGRSGNPASAELERLRAGRVARRAVELAARHADDPAAPAAHFRAELVLAAIALRHGDQGGAVAHLLEAPETTTSAELAWASHDFEADLLTALLDRGERAAIVRYLERTARVRPVVRDRWLAAARDIREGWRPAFAAHAR